MLAHSAHPAFDKAAHFMGLDTVRTPLAADFRADPAAIAAAITADTVMVVASAPAYPHGVMDPIAAVAAVAAERSVWMHVDACVGGYIAPFARMLGAPIEPFDFAVPGVTSISADLHKYGYAAKGASTLFFADAASFAGMAYAFDNWPRGQYATNTLVGTRAGGAIAAAWAVMNYLGEEGYLRVTRRVLDTREAYQRGVEALGFRTLGRPELAILAFGSERDDIAAVGRAMTQSRLAHRPRQEPARTASHAEPDARAGGRRVPRRPVGVAEGRRSRPRRRHRDAAQGRLLTACLTRMPARSAGPSCRWPLRTPPTPVPRRAHRGRSARAGRRPT